jgi:hypothetical protein
MFDWGAVCAADYADLGKSNYRNLDYRNIDYRN